MDELMKWLFIGLCIYFFASGLKSFIADQKKEQ